jgi:hypothetical protein
VVGGWSRAQGQKSLKLYARNEYEAGMNTFAYDFFPDDFSYYGRPITDYSRLILQNGGNDAPFAYARDETVMACAATVLPDTHSKRAAAVFLNGEYYGFVWLRQVVNDDYLDAHNEMRNGEWVVLEGGEGYMGADEDKPLELQAREDYLAMYNMYKEDLTDDQIFAAFCELVDLENLLRYYAVQIYVDNGDWPWGNYEVYRYYGEEESLVRDGVSTAEGKWRFLLQDTDWTFKLYGEPRGDLALARILRFVRSDRGHSPLLIALLKRDDMKARFVTILCDLMNQHFSPQRIEEVVRGKEAERYNELNWNFRLGGAAQLRNSWSSMVFVDGQIEAIIAFGQRQPLAMLGQIQKYLEVSILGYRVVCSAHELADIKISTCTITDDFEGFYYDISTLEVSASEADGWEFSHWLVNGEAVREEIITIGRANAINGRIYLELVLKAREEGDPIVRLIDYEGGKDYLELYNPYSFAIDLRNYFISDDPADPQKQRLTLGRLAPGGSVILYGENYRDLQSLQGAALSFNLSNGEILTITNIDEETVFSLELPQLDNDYVLVRNPRNGEYRGVKRE